MRQKIAAAISAAALLATSVFPVLAATEGSVTATVTVQSISITVSDGTVAYGTLAVNTSKDTTSGGVNDTQTATNNGNVTEDFLIRGQNSANWTLAVVAGVDQYIHQFCIAGTGVPDPCDATPTYTALTTSNQTVVNSVATSGTQKFDLKITTPTSSSVFTQQNVNVTVVAVAS